MLAKHNKREEQMQEFWEQYKDTDYLVSTLGNVWGNKRNHKMALTDDGCGYLKVNLSINSKSVITKVHRMVAIAFIANPDVKPTVNHIDGTKYNNHVDNLEWASMKEQIDHAYSAGLLPPTWVHLSELDVECIKLAFVEGYNDAYLSKKFNVCAATISNIRKLKNWRHIRPDLLFSLSSPGYN